ncbi:MAG TPA: LCP family protein [Acidimicrobiales bacterium]|nr:LCP family protein [Acidimicrobiales bacterium]
MSRDSRHLRGSGPLPGQRPPPAAWDRARRRPAAPGEQDGGHGDRGRDPRHGLGSDGEPDPGSGPRLRRSWRQRVILAALTSIVVVCLAGASVGGYVLVKYNSINRVDNLSLDQPPSGDPENYLIVAVDTREGQASRNTDTIMVARVDPKSDRLALTSFPRDLMVTIADTNEIGMINSAYSRPNEGEGEQNLINTLRQNFGVPIHHFVEVNFESFKRVVDDVGGVSIWFPTAVRDKSAGLYVDRPGCKQLDGQMALAFARSRKLQIMTPDGWTGDPRSDLSRVQRQQVFIHRALSKALSQVRSNPLRVTDLVNIAADTVRFDKELGVRDMIDLGNHFSDFDSEKLETYNLPTLPYPPDLDRVLLDEKNAQPALNVFRGLPPGELSPVQATITVLNATTKEGFARDISGALQRIGFEMTEPDTTDPAAATTVQHAPGQADFGELVARYLTTRATLVENPELGDGEVVVVAGADFTTVHDQPTPTEQTTATTAGGQPAVSSTTTEADSTADTATAATNPPATTTTTEANPFIIGEPPRGETCE